MNSPTGAGDHLPGSAPPAVEVRDVTLAYPRTPVLRAIDLLLPAGHLIGIVGPNGAGKTTLLKAILGLVPLASGRVEVFGQPLRTQRRRIGYVPQRETVDWDFPVSALDVVLMGRYGRLGWFHRPRRTDHRTALDALARVRMSDFADRQINQLSGGHQQRVFLARALAQDADPYFMDEPFAGVDAATESAIVEILRAMRAGGKTVIAVHHDLQTVADYFDRVVLLNMRVVAAGPTADVFTRQRLQETYGGRLTLLEEAAEAVRQGQVS